MFWDRQLRTERAQILREVRETMRRHHRNAPGPEAHPQDGFLAPQTLGSQKPAEVAGGVPVWEL